MAGTLLITADYLIGCDGPASEIRRQIGARLTGDALINRTQSTYIRAPSLIRRMQAVPAWSTQSLNPRRSAGMFAVDGRETWLVHNYLRPDETDFATVDRDRCIRLILGVGPEFEYQVLTQEDWIGRRMLADRFRNGRVFICGDAAHIWVPYAGYGMNAGIADAMNLSWMLAGVLQGWAAPAILDAYEAERRPITEQVSHYAMNTAHVGRAVARGGSGEHRRYRARRRSCARAFRPRVDRPSHATVLLRRAEFRLFLRSAPRSSRMMGKCRHPTRCTTSRHRLCPAAARRTSGCATDGLCTTRWVHRFTLLRFDRSVPVDALAGAAAKRGVPLAVLDVEAEEARSPYAHKLVLSRPDQHVAWRGNAEPNEPMALIDLVRGATMPSSAGICGATFRMNSVRLCATSS